MDIQSRLNNVLAKEENKICADCNTKNPRWVSISLGVVICIRCCGHHRSMGTHISKVKSITLDTWNNDMVIVFERLNNNVINQFWERNKPTNQSKPVESSSSYTVESYIRDKYQRKLWAPRDEVDPATRVLSLPAPQTGLARTETPQMKAVSQPTPRLTQPIDLFSDVTRNNSSQISTVVQPVFKSQPVQAPSYIPSVPAPSFPQAALITMPEFPQVNMNQTVAPPQVSKEEEERKRKIDQLMMMYQQTSLPQPVQNSVPQGFQPLGAIAAQNLISARGPQAAYPTSYLNPGQWPSF